jgi:hypothetical protein
MSHARALAHMQREVLELLTVFRFRSRQAIADVDECMAHWPEAPGARFAISILGPQRDLLGDLGGLLERLAADSERASLSAARCEGDILHVRAGIHPLQQTCGAALGAASLALEHAGHATSLAAEVEASAARIAAAAAGIGLPL